MSSPSQNGQFSPPVSQTAEQLEPSVRLEMARFGLLVDWELVKLMSSKDWELVRLSFTWKDDEVLMVVKLISQGVPYVVFIGRQSPTHCMKTLVRKAREGTLMLYPDRFA